MNCGDFVQFIDFLNTTPISQYHIDNLEEYFSKEEMELTLLDNYKLHHVFENRFDALKSRSEDRFNIFYSLCNNHKHGQEIYNKTRDFIANNGFITKDEIDNILFDMPYDEMNKEARDGVKKFLKRNYSHPILQQQTVTTCKRCGYLVGDSTEKFKIHRFCQDSGIEKRILPAGTLIADDLAYKSIIRPNIFENEIREALDKNKIEYEIYPSLEKMGDIKIIVNENIYYLDAKCYEDVSELAKELESREHYKSRIIVVPERVYLAQYDILQPMGYLVHSIETLLRFLKEVRRNGKK
jgi:hypothetical protein